VSRCQQRNFSTLWCKRRLTEADTPTIRLGATPSGLTSAHLHHPPFFTGWMPFLPPNQQCQSTEDNNLISSKIICSNRILQFLTVGCQPWHPTNSTAAMEDKLVCFTNSCSAKLKAADQHVEVMTEVD